MRVALVHDFLLRFGGAERVLQVLHEMFPQAPIYTVFFDTAMQRFFPGATIVPSWLERVRTVSRNHRMLLPFIPHALETFDMRGFDLVISSSSAFAKGVITKPETVHICYCHTPPRFLWEDRGLYRGRLVKPLAALLSHWLRVWDIHAAHRPDLFIANSEYTARRIKKYYRRDAEVIYPPVLINPKFSAYGRSPEGRQIPNPKQLPITNYQLPKDYFLLVSQLRPYKRIDIAVDTFSKLGLPLVVVGEGPERKRLQARAAPNITFLGWQDDAALERLYADAHALIFPSVEDFGLTPIEAMAFGKPVLAIRRGGAEESVHEGVSGEFFEEQTQESLSDGVRRLLEGLRENRYQPEVIEDHAKRFSKERFIREFRSLVENAIKDSREG